MSTSRPIPEVAAPAAAVPSLGRDLWEMAKPRLTGLVLVTTGVGYFLGLPLASAGSWTALLATLLGTGLVSAAASVLNQLAEREYDQRMLRTADRPLAAGRLQGWAAGLYALLASFIGLSLLCIESGHIAAGIALTTLWIYVAVYTPLKRRSAANTLVGAVSGALPPLIGWTAAGAPLNAGAISLFMILFVWQIPHFLAIAVLYRDDYARGGYRMLPVGEGGLERTAKTARRYSAFFIPVALLPSFVGLGGIAYGVGALLLSGWFLKVTMRFSSEPTRERARSLFLASIAVLPALLILLCADAAVGR